MKQISVEAFQEVLEVEKQNPAIDFINVCTPAEYKEKHIPGVRNVPLDELEAHLSEFQGKERIYIHCRSGKRGRKASEKLNGAGIQAGLINVEGGLMAWEQAGFATGSSTKRLPIIRQVLAVAGALIVLFSLLSIFVHPLFSIGVLVVGAGLLIAGFTGWCGMAIVLSRMPWNK